MKNLLKDISAKRILLSGLGIVSLVFAVPIILYLYVFADRELSEQPEAWGLFGDYIGGTLNPILALTNLVVTIWIAILLNTFSNDQTEKQIEAQKQIVLIQLRMEAFREFRSEFNSAFQQWETDRRHPPHIDHCIDVLNSFSEAYYRLFKLKKNQELIILFKELNFCKDTVARQNHNIFAVHYANAKRFKGIFYSSLVK